jgi:enoyl-CoA hydratase
VACDLRVATADASFGIPAAKLGLMVNHWTVQRVATLAGPSVARAILLAAEVVTGRPGPAPRSREPRGRPARGAGVGEQIAKLAPLTIAGHKLMLNRLESAPPHDADVAAAFDRAWDERRLRRGHRRLPQPPDPGPSAAAEGGSAPEGQ